MPELPEVERARRFAESVAHRRTIETVTLRRDPIVFAKVGPRRFHDALTGRRIEAVGRRGKHFWFQLDQPPWLVLHLGMTGRLNHYHHDVERPDYLKLEISLDDGNRLSFADPRRFGRIRLQVDPLNEPPISRLGFDPLLDMPGRAGFQKLLVRRNAPIKAVLLDQGFAAGVGNWIADEVLYQAKVDPRRKASELTDREIDAIRRKLKQIITKAVDVDADKNRFPKSWLFHHRWRKKKGATTAKGESIVFDTVASRTTAWVPTVQR